MFTRVPARALALVSTFLLMCAPDLRAQPQTQKDTNPLAGNARAIEQGRVMFRGRCAACHGIDAKGYRGSDLTTGEWTHGGSDRQLFQTIGKGVPGTEMPGNGNMSEDEVWMVIAYLRTLSATGATPDRGDAKRGEQIFWAKDKGNCSQCHMIDGRGGRLGPELSRIGASRSVAALEREIRRPGEFIPVGFETVTVVTREGRKIRGTRKNEDTFSIQIMTGNEEILSLWKRDLTEVTPDPQSLMPVYGPERLPDTDLFDVVRYLKTLKGRPLTSSQ
jgi:cytochrome c oxidase cbb3-type subunit III